MDEDTKRALPLLFLLLFVVAMVPIGVILESLVPQQIWLEIAPVLFFLLLPIAVFAVGTLYMERRQVISLRTCVIAMTVSITVILLLLFLFPWLVSRGLISLNAIKSLPFTPIALISCLVTLLLLGVAGIVMVPGRGTLKERKRRVITHRGPMTKKEKEAYHKGYSDHLPFEDKPSEWRTFYMSKEEKEAYTKGWKDSKEGKPPYGEW